MSAVRAVVDQFDPHNIPDTDTLLVGNGIQPNTGDLTVSAEANSLVLKAGSNASTDTTPRIDIQTTSGSCKLRFKIGSSAPTNTSGNGYLLLPNGSAPTSATSGGGALYVSSGALRYYGTSSDHLVAAAGPHCGACGHDAWRIGYVNRTHKAYLFECAWCGAVYKSGPESIRDALTPEQQAEVLEAGMGWDEVLAVWEGRTAAKPAVDAKPTPT